MTPTTSTRFVAEERRGLRGPLRQLRRGRACASRPRATSRRCARCAAPTPASAPTSAPRTPASRASTTPATSTRPPTARPAAPSPATATPTAATSSPRTTTTASTPSPTTYDRDGAALEILRLTELARVYRAYEEELAAPRRPRLRGADRPRHAAVQDAPQRPAPLAAPVPLHPGGRVPGRQRRPDRAHRAPRPHAGPPRQRHGRGRRRPVHLPLPRRQLRRLRRVRRPVSRGPDGPRRRASSRTSAPSATS